MIVASALSTHPLVTHAVGECVGTVLDSGAEPDVVLVGVTAPLVGAMEDVVGAVRSLLRPRVLAGAASTAVMAGTTASTAPAVAVWALWAGGGAAPRPLRVEPGDTSPVAATDGATVLLADPFTTSCAELVEARAGRPGLAGGSVDAATRAGGNRLVLDGELHSDGAVGVVLPSGWPTDVVVATGAVAVGEPLTVTAADDTGRHVASVGGRPALERLLEALGGLPEEDRPADPRDVSVGVTVADRPGPPDPSQVRLVAIEGADRRTGALRLGAPAPTGTTVQFHVRSPSTGSDTAAVLAGRSPLGALVFVDPDRLPPEGRPAGDLESLHDARPGVRTLGWSTGEQLGTVAGVPTVWSGSAGVVVVGDDAAGGRPGAL